MHCILHGSEPDGLRCQKQAETSSIMHCILHGSDPVGLTTQKVCLLEGQALPHAVLDDKLMGQGG